LEDGKDPALLEVLEGGALLGTPALDEVEADEPTPGARSHWPGFGAGGVDGALLDEG
jgi:hypothetical protein